MKLITRASRAAEAATFWRRQYGDGYDGWPGPITRALEALGPNPDPDAVDAAIGNPSWTECFACDECGQPGPVVRLGEEPECARICQDCLRKALALFEGAAHG